MLTMHSSNTKVNNASSFSKECLVVQCEPSLCLDCQDQNSIQIGKHGCFQMLSHTPETKPFQVGSSSHHRQAPQMFPKVRTLSLDDTQIQPVFYR